MSRCARLRGCVAARNTHLSLRDSSPAYARVDTVWNTLSLMHGYMHACRARALVCTSIMHARAHAHANARTPAPYAEPGVGAGAAEGCGHHVRGRAAG